MLTYGLGRLGSPTAIYPFLFTCQSILALTVPVHIAAISYKKGRKPNPIPKVLNLNCINWAVKNGGIICDLVGPCIKPFVCS